MGSVNFLELSILLVEDQSFITQIIGRLLRSLGCKQVEITHNGQEALDLLKSGQIKPNLILCDLDMPIMNGFEFLETIRSDPWPTLNAVPVIVLTAHKDEESIKRVIPHGIHGYLLKPVSQDALIKKISHAMSMPMIDPSVVSK